MGKKKSLQFTEGVTTTNPNADDLVAGPTTTVDNTLPRFDGVEGDLQTSGVTIDDNNVVTADSFVAGGTGANTVPAGSTAQRPGSPAAGMIRYNSDEGTFEGYTSQWGSIGGGGLGGVNLLEDEANAATGVGNWVDSGSSTVSVAKETSTIPLGSVRDSALKFTISGSPNAGDYQAITFTMPEALKNMKLGIAWFQQVSGYTADALRVELWTNSASNYGGTYTEVALADDDDSGDSTIADVTGKYQNYFDAGDAAYYELRIEVTSSATGSEILYINDLEVGPGTRHAAPALTAWIDDTSKITLTNFGTGSPTVDSFKYMQAGETIFFEGQFTCGTSPAASPYISFTDWNVASTYNDNDIIGSFEPLNSAHSSTANQSGVLFYNGSNTDRLYTAVSKTNRQFDTNQPCGSGDVITFKGYFRCAELAGKGTVNTLVEDNLKLVGEGDTGSTTWDGTAPTGTVTSKYRWARTGNMIDFWWRYEASTQGSTNSTVSFTLPSDVPAPATFSTDGGNEWLGFQGSGTMANSVASSGAGAGFAALRQVGGVTQVYVDREAATNAAYASCHIRFITSETITQNSLVGFSDATTTKSGLRKAEKQYIGGTDVTVTSNAAATVDFKRSVFVPYQTYDGAWRMKFNIVVFHGSDASHSITVSGATFKNTTSYNQACDCVGNAMQAARAFAQPNVSTIFVQHAAAVTETYVSGDVELESKPTWAD